MTSAQPGFNREHLELCTPEELLQLLIANEDRVPRELIDECVARGPAMLPLLRSHLDDARHWEDVTDDGHWWALLHAIHILGAMEGEATAHALLAAFQRMDTSRDDHLWE
jgi:hypothetical protein